MASKNTSMLFIIIQIFFISSAIATERQQLKAEREQLEALIKKYGSYRPKEVLLLNDYLLNEERTDVQNKYYHYSYPKCIKVEPIVVDSIEVTNRNSAGIRFLRSTECNPDQKYEELLISHYENIESKFVNNFSLRLPLGLPVVYAQAVSINTSQGKIYAEIGTSHSPETTGQPYLAWSIDILCTGKRNEVYKISFQDSQSSAIDILEKKKFKLPEDFKKIISSFKCRKDR